MMYNILIRRVADRHGALTERLRIYGADGFSFIHVDDFCRSPKDLAKYLHLLDKDHWKNSLYS